MSKFTEKLKNIGKNISDLASETTEEIAGKIKEIGNEVPGQLSEKTEEIAEKTKTFSKTLLNKGKVFYKAGKEAASKVNTPQQDKDTE